MNVNPFMFNYHGHVHVHVIVKLGSFNLAVWIVVVFACSAAVVGV